MQFRPIDMPHHDLPALLELWARCFGPDWPIQGGSFCQIACPPGSYQPGDHLFAWEDGQPVGFALTQPGRSGSDGSILALGVRPDLRRRGIGRGLHQAALARLAQRGVRQVQLGSGGMDYFWPGVPCGQTASPPGETGAWEFFAALGWPYREASFDLLGLLDGWQAPAWVWARVAGLGLVFRPAEAGDERAVLAMVSAEEAGWLEYYAAAFREGRAGDVILAGPAGAGGAPRAVCLVGANQRWQARFPVPCAAPACVLTAQASREQGVGLALVARACQLCSVRGFHSAFIGWTWLVEWYGRLGFRPWQTYAMSWTEMDALRVSAA